MNKKRLVLVVVFALSALLITTTIVVAQTTLSRLTVKNNSDHTVSMLLREADVIRHSAQNIEYVVKGDGEVAFFDIPAGETKIFTMKRAVYTYTLRACGGDTLVKDAIDLTNYRQVTIPKLCEFYWDTYEEVGVIDGILTQKTDVGFSVNNPTDITLLAVLSGPETVALQLEPNETRFLTVEEGTYTLSWSYCEKGEHVRTKTFIARFHETHELDCDYK
jgi:hypothetical protein